MLRNLFLYEDFRTSYFKADNIVFSLFVVEGDITQVYLMMGDEVYNNLSVILPDSEKLEDGEFYLNPEISEKIVKVLVEQNFISETGKEAIAGNKRTKSYILV